MAPSKKVPLLKRLGGTPHLQLCHVLAIEGINKVEDSSE